MKGKFYSTRVLLLGTALMVIVGVLNSQLVARAQETEPQTNLAYCEGGGWTFVEPEAPAEVDRCTAEIELIRTTESERLQAMVDAEMEVAEQLHTDDFQLISPGGLVLSKEEYLGFIASGEVDYLVWEPISDIEVRLYGEAAVIRYQSQTEIIAFGDRLSVHNWHTDSYEKRDGRWQVVWSQATTIEQ